MVLVAQVPQQVQLSFDLVKVHRRIWLLSLCGRLLGLLRLLELLLLLLLQRSQEERIDVRAWRDALELGLRREGLLERDWEGKLCWRSAWHKLRLLLHWIPRIPWEGLGHAIGRLLLLVVRLAVWNLGLVRSCWWLSITGWASLLLMSAILVSLP